MYTPTRNPFPPDSNSRMIWGETLPSHWVEHVYFRREIQLDSAPTGAVIALYASTDYHLVVNGVMVGTGPVRGYTDSPEYDSYDILDYLAEGANVIAVEVQHVGYSTFQHPLKPAGCICWGQVEAEGGETLDLSTPGDWKCCVSKAHDPFPPRFSFSLGPTMQFDARKAPTGWDRPGQAAGTWTAPQSAPESEVWGEWKPREIPHLTQKERSPMRMLGAWTHAALRTVGLRAYHAYEPTMQRPPKAMFTAWTWVHSPEDCEIQVLSRWSDWVLNGQKIKNSKVSQGVETSQWSLKKGWNFLAAGGGSVLGIWEMQLGLPAESALHFSSEKSLESPETCRMRCTHEDAEVADLLATISPDTIENIGDWEKKVLDPHGSSPVLNLLWPSFEEQIIAAGNLNDPIDVPATKAASVMVDMGVITLGRIFVEFEAPEGTVLDVGYAEEMRGDRPAHYKMDLVNSGERHIAREGRQRMETFCPRGSRFLQIGIFNATAPVRIHKIGMVEAMYPYDFQSSFRCSDPQLNNLWDWGRWTLQICSEDVVVDTPWRERGLYGGDMLAEWGTMLASSGDGRLIRRCIDIYFQTQDPKSGWMPGRVPNQRGVVDLSDYALLVFLAHEWYCRTFNDVEFAKRINPKAKKLIDGLKGKQGADGFYRSSSIFIAHAYPHKKTADCLSTVFNALAMRALEAWASLEDMTGGSGEETRQLAAGLSEKFNETFFDKERNAFVDQVLKDGSTVGHSLYANAWSLLYANPTEPQIAGALKRMEEELEQFDHKTECVSPYGSFYALGALYRHHAPRLAERLIHKVYAEMLSNPSGTIWEQSLSDKSMSHAWSTAPTYYCTTQIAGIQMGWPFHEEPDVIRIAPQTDALTWAEAEALHPRGTIKVRWQIRGEKLFLDYESPEGVKVEVAPAGKLADMECIINSNR